MSLPYRYSKERTLKHLPKWRKPSPAMIVAIAALVVSVGGTAVAGPIAEISLNKGEKKQIRKISGKVSNRQITQRAPGLSVAAANIANVANAANVATTANNAKTVDDEAIDNDKLADDSVDGSKVSDDSLSASDLGPNSVGGSEIAPNAVGGTHISSSAVGGDELENFHIHIGSTVTINDITALDGDWLAGTATASCTAGEQMVGYYAEWTSAGDEIAIQEIIPNFGTNEVTARGISDDGSETFRAVAICVFN